MLLTIDVGNTSTAIGIYEASKLLGHWRTETNKKSTADEMALTLRKLFEMGGYQFDQIDGIAISSVVPSANHAYQSMASRYFHLEPLIADYTNVGIEIQYPNPQEIGADRLVNAAEAFREYQRACIIVDFGTATTLDYVNEAGAYIGGTIAPGIMIANEALYRWTSKLPRVDVVKCDRVLANSTVGAIQSGVYHGYKGLVKHLIDEMRKEVGGKPTIVATGGLASLVVEDMDIPIKRFLTLDGLKTIFDRNG